MKQNFSKDQNLAEVSERAGYQEESLNEPLKVLEVIDELSIGPVKIEKNRLSTTYKVIRNGKEYKIDLVYKYEENIFIPNENESQNLANMIAAQVALNYGLFCKKIVFHGLFDRADQKFLFDMMENTAREIFVKKFLEDNPFLSPEVSDLPAVKLKKYSQAKLEFPSVEMEKTKIKWQIWETEKEKHVILSSGGKDSLLSFGLLNEIGKEVHPIFINESGRHWFTAVNAYRYFKDNIPNTARVWVNSDRVFAWMLRHLPFVRSDFASLRSDEYPIRLWTVAVFLFGAIPLMRKRNIGRLLIGDEFDTTIRAAHEGISHYNGLYDQSRYFDNALSRYYLSKGWSISQFSIIRPLSEMLIEKILVERYPHLQIHQMSCHATHVEGDRVKPCGKCEKCRRIVGMLIAIGGDPKVCGYTENQIKNCLNDLTKLGIHQESAGERHLLFSLSRKGVLTLSQAKKKKLSENGIVMKLRLDHEKSPMDGIPVNLRKPLFNIYLKHAKGAVLRKDRKWLDFHPLESASINTPYSFEMDTRHGGHKQSSKESQIERKIYLWGELSWPEAEKRLEEVDLALLPVGAIEQHGPHLPLDTDAFDAEYLAQRVAKACSTPKPLVLPLISYGVSYHHDEFKGTISISNDTLSQLVYEIGISAAKNGIKKLLIINGHGGNSPALNHAAQMINRDAHIFVAVDTGETSDVDIEEIVETLGDVHAGEIETSTALTVRPHLVKMSKASKLVPQFSSRYLDFSSKRGIIWYAYTKKLSSSGVMGDPTKASSEKGRKIWKIMIAHLVALVEDLKSMSLEELYQKKY
jgi:creatinine amidohydrolase/Fe(II)-dependent formamide hydrolase-like protein